VRLSGKFLGTAVMLRSGHRCSNVSRRPDSGSDTTPYGDMPATAPDPRTGPADRSVRTMRALT
jgi:hypothetical protein